MPKTVHAGFPLAPCRFSEATTNQQQKRQPKHYPLCFYGTAGDQEKSLLLLLLFIQFSWRLCQ